MPTSSQLIAAIRRKRRPALIRLWEQIKAGDAPGWEPGKALEYLILRGFEVEGAAVVWPYPVVLRGQEMEQIDGAVHIAGLSCLIESKDLSEPVDITPLAKLPNQLNRRPAGTMGVVFARSGFTELCRILAQYMLPLQIVLWEGDELEYAVRNASMIDGLRAKHRYAVEHGLPDYFIRPVVSS